MQNFIEYFYGNQKIYSTQITTSENETKTTWKSINDKKTIHEEIHSLCVDGKIVNNNFNISNTFNDEFLSTTGKVNNNSTNIMNLDVSLHMDYLFQTFKIPFRILKLNTHQINRKK